VLPPWDNVLVQVIGYAGTSELALIHTQIESLSLCSSSKDFHTLFC
jgi:hypothetical protein